MGKVWLGILLVVVVSLTVFGDGVLRIWHFNVGQTDCTLLLSPSGVSVLFDCGEETWSASRNAAHVAERIESITGGKSLDYFVLSHFHLDHVGYIGRGGLSGLLDKHAFTIQTLVVRDYTNCTGNVGDWASYMLSSSQVGTIQTVSATSGSIDLGAGVSMTFLSANGEPRVSPLGEPACSGLDENDLSIGALISYGDFQEWIGGDIGGVSKGDHTDIETYVAASIGDIEVLRVNHHGSRYSSNETFLVNLDPEVSIISTGVGNTHGHPNPDVINRLCATSDVYMTSIGTGEWNHSGAGEICIVGEIYITTDGIKYSVNGKLYDAFAAMRVDEDGDGYYADVDPDDSDANSIPVECVTPAGDS